MPMRSILGVRPARLSCIQRRNTGSKHEGSSCEYPGIAGRQVHSFDPLRRSLYSPPGDDGQSSRVASFVMNAGPVRSASAIFSPSVTGNPVHLDVKTVNMDTWRQPPGIKTRITSASHECGSPAIEMHLLSCLRQKMPNDPTPLYSVMQAADPDSVPRVRRQFDLQSRVLVDECD
jgi:hypothetical protein